MKYAKGDLLLTPCDVIVFTGNDTIRSDGALVMGRGLALEIQRAYPGINKRLGSQIRQYKSENDDDYGMVVDPYTHDPKVVAFQVKRHYADAADPALIEYSLHLLNYYASHAWRDLRVSMNFPGIGYGKLQRSVVSALLDAANLPDNVTIWEYEGS